MTRFSRKPRKVKKDKGLLVTKEDINSLAKSDKAARVYDKAKRLGTITKIISIHEVIVVMDDGSVESHCLDMGCIDFDPLYWAN